MATTLQFERPQQEKQSEFASFWAKHHTSHGWLVLSQLYVFPIALTRKSNAQGPAESEAQLH